MVPPLAGDAQVAGRSADQGEAGALEDRLGGEVVHEGGGLHAVQAVVTEAFGEDVGARAGGHAAAGPAGGDPVAERAAAEGAVDDVGDVDTTDQSAGGLDEVGIGASLLV